MNTQQLVSSVKIDNPDWSAQQIYSYLNTPRTIDNPVPQGQVLASVNISTKAALLLPAQRVIIENQLSGTWLSLLSNFGQGKMPDVVGNVENLVASGLLSPATIAVLQATVLEASTPVLDPNYQTTVTQPPYADYGLTPVLIGDC